MKIAVAGVGYVGLSLAVLLSQHDEVYAVSSSVLPLNMNPATKSAIATMQTPTTLMMFALRFWSLFF